MVHRVVPGRGVVRCGVCRTPTAKTERTSCVACGKRRCDGCASFGSRCPECKQLGQDPCDGCASFGSRCPDCKQLEGELRSSASPGTDAKVDRRLVQLVCPTCTVVNPPGNLGACHLCSAPLLEEDPATLSCPRCTLLLDAKARLKSCPMCGLQLDVDAECALEDERQNFELGNVSAARSTLPRSFLGPAAESAELVRASGPRALSSIHDSEMRAADELEAELLNRDAQRHRQQSEPSGVSSSRDSPPPCGAPKELRAASAGRTGALRMVLLDALRMVLASESPNVCLQWLAHSAVELSTAVLAHVRASLPGQRVPRHVLGDQPLQDICEVLLCRLCAGRDPPAEGSDHRPRLIRALLDAGVSANARDHGRAGSTALMCALRSGNVETASLLSERGAKEKPDYSGAYGGKQGEMRTLVSASELMPLLQAMRFRHRERRSSVVTHWLESDLFEWHLVREVALFVGAPAPLLRDRLRKRRRDQDVSESAMDRE